jgi:hypothetical protein
LSDSCELMQLGERSAASCKAKAGDGLLRVILCGRASLFLTDFVAIIIINNFQSRHQSNPNSASPQDNLP